MLPKVKFKVAPFEHYINSINYFLSPKKDWDKSYKILNLYPKLKKKLKGIVDKEKRTKITKEFFKELQEKDKKEFEIAKKHFQKEWNKINNKVMIALSEILEIKWPKNTMKIIAFVNPNPICPRNIKKRTYDIYYKSKIMKDISLHEILHFIYFEKWKQVFPKTKEKEFDMPYLVWSLSEMVPAVILKDERIQKIFKHKPLVYQEYINFKIKNKPLLKHLQGFYNKRKNFEDFLKQSWRFVNKYKKEIKSI